MRQVVLDTETTGLSWEKGNRIVEIGCIELLERRPTGRRFQRHLDPERDMEAGAQEVTGLTREFLAGKPKFAQVCDEFLDFVRGAELVIHNADFDVGFIDYELSLLGPHYGRRRDHAGGLDTLALARERYPGQRNSLDALCRRLGVDNAHRKLHGALLDAELLAEVFLAMTSGQGDLALAPEQPGHAVAAMAALHDAAHAVAARTRVLRAGADELERHRARLQKIAAKAGGRLAWPVDEAADADAGAPVALRG